MVSCEKTTEIIPLQIKLAWYSPLWRTGDSSALIHSQGPALPSLCLSFHKVSLKCPKSQVRFVLLPLRRHFYGQFMITQLTPVIALQPNLPMYHSCTEQGTPNWTPGLSVKTTEIIVLTL